MTVNSDSTTDSLSEFIRRTKRNVIAISSSLLATTASAEAMFHIARRLMGRNVSDVGVRMYENAGTALAFWVVGFPLLCCLLGYLFTRRITPSTHLSIWVIRVIGFELWFVHALVLAF